MSKFTPFLFESSSLFAKLHQMDSQNKEALMMHFYLIGLVLATMPKEEREAALIFASNFMELAIERYNEQSNKAHKGA